METVNSFSVNAVNIAAQSYAVTISGTTLTRAWYTLPNFAGTADIVPTTLVGKTVSVLMAEINADPDWAVTGPFNATGGNDAVLLDEGNYFDLAPALTPSVLTLTRPA